MTYKFLFSSNYSIHNNLKRLECLFKILNQIINNLFTPHYGMHLVAGASLKFPIIPLGFYIDGKYMIPFDKLDKNVDIGGIAGGGRGAGGVRGRRRRRGHAGGDLLQRRRLGNVITGRHGTGGPSSSGGSR